MRKTWVGGLVAVGIVLACEPPASALSAGDVMGFVGKQNLLGTSLTLLNSLGVFSMLGIGSDAEINSKLNEIISQLNVIESQLNALSMDLSTSTQTLIDQTISSQIGTALPSMSAAQAQILQCVDELTQLAAQPHSDANDAMMLSHAMEIVGGATTTSDCSYVRQNFNTIHSQMVSGALLGKITSGIYTLIARVAWANNVPYENIAAHFVQYELVQRQAVDLLRSAYLALGDPATMQLQLQQAPNYLGQLHDEEIAFLSATDTYIADNPTMPHDTSPAALADAVVQGFEGNTLQASTYSLSILDNAQSLTPVLTPPGASATPVAMSDTIAGVQGTYYDLPDMVVNTDLTGCDLTPASPGFSFVRPINGAQGGFKIGFGCALTVERHLNTALPANIGATWTVTGRNGVSPPIGAPTLRNVVTSVPETADAALALAADPNAIKSPFAILSIVADTTDPTSVIFTVDLPGQTGAVIGAGTTHAFVAGSASPVPFTRVPQGPRDPNAYAFETAAATYLAIGSDGYATLAATPTYFDVTPTSDGHVLVTTPDGQNLYVDYQYQQFFYGEAPDDVWGNVPNLLANATAVGQWTYPDDGIPRTAPSTTSIPPQLDFYPPCLDSTGAAQFAGTRYSSPGPTAVDSYYARCSNNLTNIQGSSPLDFHSVTDLSYVEYDVPIVNQDSVDHAFQVTILGDAIGPASSVVDGTSYAGFHCYVPNAGSPLNHFDSTSVATQPVTATSTGEAGPFLVPVTANSSVTIQCQALDDTNPDAQLIITNVEVAPCRSDASQPCVTFQ